MEEMNNQNAQTILLNNMMVELVKTEAGHYLIADNIIDAINAEIARLRKVEAEARLLSLNLDKFIQTWNDLRDIDDDYRPSEMLEGIELLATKYKITK